MPLQRCQRNGVRGWRWGNRGRCYVGSDAKKKAMRQAAAIRASGFTENRAALLNSIIGLLEEFLSDDVESLAERIVSLVDASAHGK